MYCLKAEDLGQAYNRRFVFKGVSFELCSGSRLVILGSNGSGKSTLLKTLSGATLPFSGSINLTNNGQLIDAEKQYKYVSLAAPYLELIEEYTLRELLNFCEELRPWRADWHVGRIIEYTYLQDSADRQIKYFSSGMKQRVRLALAVLADTPVLLLDEPTSNLDKGGVEWYKELMDSEGRDRLIVVASNENREEYYFCDRELRIEDFK